MQNGGDRRKRGRKEDWIQTERWRRKKERECSLFPTKGFYIKESNLLFPQQSAH